MSLVSVSRKLAQSVDQLTFGSPVSHTYNPLVYAAKPHEAYLKRYGEGPKKVLFLGMNPGPFGMAQTGVPFGDVTLVRDWLGIEDEVGSPATVHPKRPVEGFGCSRREVSGSRLWGWAQERFVTPERFFATCFVANYCPLLFLEDRGRNRTPDKLPAAERDPLFSHCDTALAALLATLAPTWLIGVGKFAEQRAKQALGQNTETRIGTILHPSPASPAANRGWAEIADQQLKQLGVSQFF